MRVRSHGSSLPMLLSIGLLTCACGPRSGGPEGLPDGLPEDVAAALAALPDAEVLALGKDSLPTFVHGMLGKGPPQLDAGKADEALASAMDPITPVFRLEVPEIRVVAVWRDDAGFTHARYQQTHEGLEVVGGDLSVHMNPRGEIYAVHGTARGSIDVDLVPSITDQQALALLAVETGARPADLEVPDLVIKESTVDQHMHLAYRARGVGPRGVPFTGYVDAHDGVVLSVEEAHVPVLARTLYDAGGREVRPGRKVRSEGDGPVGDADTDAAFDDFGKTWLCYHDLFERDSVDGEGLPLEGTVHWGDHYANAYWDGTNHAMVFGDGDGEEIGPLAQASDVVTHELTHGVVEFSAGLVYQDEPGALNEGYADIMAAVCDAHLKGASDEATYLVGEDAYTPGTPGDAIRYMSDPERDGYSVGWWPNRVHDWWDNGGVHTNSGIANLAFYLLAEGGQNPRHSESARVPGIGVERAGAIFYRALVQYLTSQADFAAARAATVRAALDLEGRETAAIVSLAWDAVGVPSPDTPMGPEVPVEACDNGVDDDGDGLIDCADPACTARGSCSTPYVNGQGPVQITEVMIDPTASEEPAGEWFEVYNWSNEPVDLAGFVIESAGGAAHRIARSVVVAPGAFAVLAYAADPGMGFTPDYVYGPSGVRLSNRRDSLSLYDAAGNVVDGVSWGTGADVTFRAAPRGRSVELQNVWSGEEGPRWGPSDAVAYDAAGDRGTPGTPPPLGAPRPPRSGDLAITEIYFDPTTAKPGGEWIEVQAMNWARITLDGLTLSGRDGRASVVSAPGVVLEPGQRAVLCRDPTLGPSGCLPYGPPLRLPNDGGFVSLDSTLGNVGTLEYRFDATFPAPVEGTSLELDEAKRGWYPSEAILCPSKTPWRDGYASPGVAGSCTRVVEGQ